MKIVKFQGIENVDVFINPDDVSAIVPSDYAPTRNSYVVLKNGEKILVQGMTYAIQNQIEKSLEVTP